MPDYSMNDVVLVRYLFSESTRVRGNDGGRRGHRPQAVDAAGLLVGV